MYGIKINIHGKELYFANERFAELKDANRYPTMEQAKEDFCFACYCMGILGCSYYNPEVVKLEGEPGYSFHICNIGEFWQGNLMKIQHNGKDLVLDVKTGVAKKFKPEDYQ